MTSSRMFKRFGALFAVLALLMAITPTMAYGATTKTVSKTDFTTSTKTLNKRATTVKKGTTTLKFKKGQGYLKFKAPTSKTYTFTFSNFKNGDAYGVCAFFETQTPDSDSPTYSFLKKVKTNGGKTDTLWIGTKNYKGMYVGSEKNALKRRRSTRYAKVSLKKGQMIYFYFSSATTKSVKATVKIK